MSPIPPNRGEPAADTATASRPRRTYSQLALYDRCPYSYLLREEERVWDRPDAWRPHAAALHAAIEMFERSGRTASRVSVGEVFRDVYFAEIREMKDRTPRIPGTVVPDLSWWAASGEYTAAEDIARREQLGLRQADAYLDFCAANPDQVPWTGPDGTLAVELTLEIDLGGVPVVAQIDQILQHPEHDLIVRDFRVKRPRRGTHQLCVLALAVNISFGTDIDQGDYWIGDSGRPTTIRALVGRDGEVCSVDHLTGRFTRFNDAVTAGDFPPKPATALCGSCSVNHACRFRAA
jgi:putative RecB family exonuclease